MFKSSHVYSIYWMSFDLVCDLLQKARLLFFTYLKNSLVSVNLMRLKTRAT